MKLTTEYLEHARHFEQMAGKTNDADLREKLLEQAVEYRRLAEKRAAQKGQPTPLPEAPQGTAA